MVILILEMEELMGKENIVLTILMIVALIIILIGVGIFLGKIVGEMGKFMKKEKIISIILKVIALIIILIGVIVFLEYKLWENRGYDFEVYLRIFVPILVLGFSGTLYGLAALLNKDKQ